MAVKVKERRGAWWIFANHNGQRRAKLIGKGKAGKKLAEQLRDRWDALIKLGEAAQVFEKATPAAPASAFPKLRDAVPAWLVRQEASGDIRGATPSAYLAGLRTWVFPHRLPDGQLLGDLPIDQVTREMLGAVIKRVKAAGRSVSVIGHIVNPLRKFFEEQVETKTLTASPTDRLTYFIGRMQRGRRVGIFDAAECATLLRAAEGTRWGAFVAAALGTGMRWGELAALTRDDVDLERGRLHVRHSWSSKVGKLQPPKNGQGRFIPMPSELLEVMRAQVEQRTAEGWSKDALVFPAENGRHLRHTAYAWSGLLKRAGLRHRAFHTCRHTFASHALRVGVRPELVQRWLGHSTLSMTLDVYREFIPDHEADAADAAKLGSILKGGRS